MSPAGDEQVGLTDGLGTPLDPATLCAHTAPIGPDRVAHFTELARRTGRIFEREGRAICSIGEAARIVLPRGLASKDGAADASAVLAAIDHNGFPALALGTVPFDSGRASSFVIPAVTVILEGASPPIGIVVGTSAEVAGHLDNFPFSGSGAPSLVREIPPDAFELVSVRTHDDFRSRVTAATAAIAHGEIDKVVLAREVTVTANRPFAPGDLVRRLRQLHPGCAAFSIDGFVGASPELLVRLSGTTAVSRPLAGTIARSGDPTEDAVLAAGLLSSPKERREHAFVVDMILTVFAELGAASTHTDPPHLLELRNVLHLATTIESAVAEGTTVLELVAALHPTPAVGGFPREAALDYLDRHEAFDRDRYAGAVGWFDGSGDGEFYIGIRSAIIEGATARLIAGAGIVEGSDADSELAETQLKLQALLAAAVRP